MEEPVLLLHIPHVLAYIVQNIALHTIYPRCL
jgi:hypothetical protein